MAANCSSCKEIVAFEDTLDHRANSLVKRVNSLCLPVRIRNNARWERFARLVNLPIVGDELYGLFLAPAGLEPEPDYDNSDWYKSEGQDIEEQAQLLEDMKAEHMEHWGDERVDARFAADPAGYYEDCFPMNPMRRSDAYNTYTILGKPEKLHIFLPDKYDFHSMAGSHKLHKGMFVLDAKSKRVVPLNQCDWSCERRGFLARTPVVYTSR